MIHRNMEAVILEASTGFPAITITGPRQSGKTTLARMLFPKYKYYNLENPETRALAKEDPRSIFDGLSEGIILDEIQKSPDLLSYAQYYLDETRLIGRLIITGSNQFEYLKDISQSLAGRTAILKLLPFSINEVSLLPEQSWEIFAHRGFYPRLYDKSINPNLYYSSYINTYLERDILALIQVRNLSQFEKFLALCAGRTGSVLNVNALAIECGVDHKTVQAWLSLLQASFVIFLLKPYSANLNKRLIKSPKLYFLDPGLACHLLGIRSESDLQHHPLKGEIFETVVMGEVVKHFYNQGLPAPISYFRDSQGHEIDLIIETAADIIPVEIKSGKTIQTSFWKNIDYLRKLMKKNLSAGIIFGDRRAEFSRNTKVSGWDRIDIEALIVASKNP